MRGAGRKRERRRDAENLRSRPNEPAVELGEAEVVTDREADRADRGRDDDGLLPRLPRLGFLRRDLAGDLDVKQMNLPIAASKIAARREQHRRVVAAAVTCDRLGYGPRLEVNAELASERAEPLARRTGDRLGELGFGSPWAAPIENLRQDDESRPLLRRAANQLLRAVEIRALVRARRHLDSTAKHGLNINRTLA